MATFGYRPATITALINFSLSEEGSELEKEPVSSATFTHCTKYCVTAPQHDFKIHITFSDSWKSTKNSLVTRVDVRFGVFGVPAADKACMH